MPALAPDPVLPDFGAAAPALPDFGDGTDAQGLTSPTLPDFGQPVDSKFTVMPAAAPGPMDDPENQSGFDVPRIETPKPDITKLYPEGDLGQRARLITDMQTPTAPVNSVVGDAVQAAQEKTVDLAGLIKKYTPMGQLQRGEEYLGDKYLPKKVMDFEHGAAGSVDDTVNFFTSPVGIATLGTGALPKAAQAAVATAFTAQMASQLPETYDALQAELAKPRDQRDWNKIGQLVTSGATGVFFTAHGGAEAEHAVTDLFTPKGSIPKLPDFGKTDSVNADELPQKNAEDTKDAVGDQLIQDRVLAELRGNQEGQGSTESLPTGIPSVQYDPATQRMMEELRGNRERDEAGLPPVFPDDAPGFATVGNAVGDQLDALKAGLTADGTDKGTDGNSPVQGDQNVGINEKVNQPAGLPDFSDLTQADDGRKVSSVTPETSTGPDERTGSVMPAEEAESSRGVTTPQENGSQGTASATISPRRQSRADAARPPDILDHIEGQYGKINLQSARGIQEDFKPTGAARKLFTSDGGSPIDEVTDNLRRDGLLGENATEDDALDAIRAAAEGRKGWRKDFAAAPDREGAAAELDVKQQAAFKRDSRRGGEAKETVVPEDLNKGDQFLLNGAKFKVTDMHFDTDGEPTMIELEDGKKYGVRQVEAGSVLKVDKGSMRPAGGDVLTEQPKDSAGNSLEKTDTLHAVSKTDEQIRSRAKEVLDMLNISVSKKSAPPIRTVRELAAFLNLNFDSPMESKMQGRKLHTESGSTDALTSVTKLIVQYWHDLGINDLADVPYISAAKPHAPFSGADPQFKAWLDSHGIELAKSFDGKWYLPIRTEDVGKRDKRGVPLFSERKSKNLVGSQKANTLLAEGDAGIKASDKSEGFSPKADDLNQLTSGDSAQEQRPVNDESKINSRQVAPKLRSGENQGDVFANQSEPFALAGEKGTDADRLAKEKAAADQSAKEGKAIQDKQQLSLEDRLDALKIDMGTGGHLQAFGMLPETWNTLVDLAKLGVKGGKLVVHAVRDAIEEIKKRFPMEHFDEDGARAFLVDKFEKEKTAPDPARVDKRSWQEIMEEKDQADRELTALLREETDKVNRSPKTNKEFRQLKNLYRARKSAAERALRTNNDYIEAVLLQQHEALTRFDQARAALKASPDDAKAQQEFMEAKDLAENFAIKEGSGGEAAARLKLARKQLKENPGDVRARQEWEAAKQGVYFNRGTDPLSRSPVKQVEAVYRDLQRRGLLPASKSLVGPETGRTLGKVTDYMTKNQIDSPKRSFRERLALGQGFAERFDAAKNKAQWALARLKGGWAAMKSLYEHPTPDSDFRKVVKDWIFADQRTGLDIHRFAEAIRSTVENPTRRKAMSVWLDAGGDETILRSQLSDVPELYKPIWEAALNLTPTERGLAESVRQEFETKADDGVVAGLIEKTRADYGVPQRWKVPPKAESGGFEERHNSGNPQMKLDPRDPFFSFARSHESYFDGIMAGGVPENLDIGHLVTVYDQAFHKSMSSRGAIAQIRDARAVDGLPVVKISGSARPVGVGEGKAYLVDSRKWNQSDVSADGRPYRSIDHFALKDWKIAFKDEQGHPIIVKGDFLVHPDHYEFLRNELQTSALRDESRAIGRVVNPIMKSNVFLKSSKLAFAGFHLATIGEHMASHLENPFPGKFKMDLTHPDQAKLVRNGLEIGMGAQRAGFEEGLASHGGLFAKVPGLGDASAKLTDWMFKEYIPKIMMKVALNVLGDYRTRYAKELSRGEITDDQLAGKVADQMNAGGGVTNYRLAGASKEVMDLTRLAALAPQFLAARARVVAQAFAPYGHAQRKLLIVQALGMYAIARVANQLLDDDPHWELRNAFSVIHNGRAYSIRTIVGDALHLYEDPASFAAGRLSPGLKLAIETMTQRDMRTGARKEPMFQTDWAPSRVVQNFVADLAKWSVPAGAEGMLPGASGQEHNLKDTALGSIGVGSRKYTARSQIYDLARTWAKNSDDAATRNAAIQKDGQVFGESPYRKLEATLDAGDVKGAQTEYDSLVKNGHSPKSIEHHFTADTAAGQTKPFTGSEKKELRFVASLTPQQQMVYKKAAAERVALEAQFDKLRK